ncbi:MAG: hypothetical protein ABJH98_01655 [Reichenbachiella sp.]|uniref:hypothetical protein n=1 Tax=Reichenbachiella sp. TaxID=2184521 RepID=UPI003298D01C
MIHEIYHTANGKVLQNDKDNRFYLEYKGKEYRMAVCALIAFKTKLDQLNVEEMLLSDASFDALEIMPLCNREHLLVLTLDEIIEMKDLIPGTLVMLELNSIVQQRLVRALV